MAITIPNEKVVDWSNLRAFAYDKIGICFGKGRKHFGKRRKCWLPAFLAHLSTECSVSYCDHSPSVGVRPSVHNLLVSTLASTNINQSSPNLVKMYMTTRAQMNSIMELIGPELSELSALEVENLPYLTMFTL